MSLHKKIGGRLFIDTLVRYKFAAAAEPLQQRKHLVLQPHSVPVEVTSPVTESESSHSEEEASMEMTEESAPKKISEDLKEFFAVRNLEEVEVYFSRLPPQHHYLLVDKIMSCRLPLNPKKMMLTSYRNSLLLLPRKNFAPLSRLSKV